LANSMQYMQYVQSGATVYGSDGDKIGDVAEVGPNYILVQQGWLFTKDIYIPLSAVSGADNDGITLNITKPQVSNMGWDSAPMEETTTSTNTAGASLVEDTGFSTRGTTSTGDDFATTSTGTSSAQDTGFSRSAATSTGSDFASTSTRASSVQDTGFSTPAATGTSEEIAIPVVEEELRVGKRAVESGGVRVTTRVEETPVNEQVTLREETVDVQRRPVDRSLNQADIATLRDAPSLEVRTHREEAVVAKEARIVEEVVVNKQAEQRTETIQDTVRHTDVNVEQVPGETRTTGYSDTASTGTTGFTDATTTGTTGYSDTASTGTTGTGNAGGQNVIGRAASGLENAAERATGSDLNRDGDVGRRG